MSNLRLDQAWYLVFLLGALFFGACNLHDYIAMPKDEDKDSQAFVNTDIKVVIDATEIFDQGEYSFGSSLTNVTVLIFNTMDEPLIIDPAPILSGDDSFAFDKPGASIILAKGESFSMIVSFIAKEETDPVFASLTINSNDPDESNLTLIFSGYKQVKGLVQVGNQPATDQSSNNAAVNNDDDTSDSDTAATSNTSNQDDKCPIKYRCNPDETKYFGDLERTYLIEKCNENTGAWALQQDCSKTFDSKGYACKCEASSTQRYSRCAWSGVTCDGAKFSW